MKLYDLTTAPNPRRVRIFLAEKGVPLPETVQIDINAFVHKEPDFAKRNPWRRIPALELDDGTVISESVAICRYFEELHPEPPLFGVGAKGRAGVEMWNRRAELGLLSTVAATIRHSHPRMASLEIPQVKEWGRGQPVARAGRDRPPRRGAGGSRLRRRRRLHDRRHHGRDRPRHGEMGPHRHSRRRRESETLARRARRAAKLERVRRRTW